MPPKKLVLLDDNSGAQFTPPRLRRPVLFRFDVWEAIPYHENVICAMKSFIEKGYKLFFITTETRVARIFLFLTFFQF